MGVKFRWTSLALAAAQPPESFSELALEIEARHLKVAKKKKRKKTLEIGNKNNRPPPVLGALRSISDFLKQNCIIWVIRIDVKFRFCKNY